MRGKIIQHPPKGELRLYWKKKLLQISPERKIEASKALADYPFPKGVIASFASFREEINTHPLNQILAQRKSLALPRIHEDELIFYHVDDLETKLERSSLGILEPIPSLCKIATQIDILLVPGLAFDQSYHRLGYGKGYYDRLLAARPAFSIGIGFKEQMTDLLPSDPHDIRLNQIVLL